MDDNKSSIWLNILIIACWVIVFVMDFIIDSRPILKVLHFALVVMWLLVLEARFQPVRRFIYWLNDQIYFNQREKLRRIKYDWFKERVKGGDGDDFEDRAKRVIK